MGRESEDEAKPGDLPNKNTQNISSGIEKWRRYHFYINRFHSIAISFRRGSFFYFPFTKRRGIKLMKLYTKTVCPKCLWIKSELIRAGIAFETINIDHDERAKEKILDAGFLTVPVIEMDGLFSGNLNDIMSKIELSIS